MEKYRYIKEIGRGNYGEVWLVKCANTSTKYVLKRIDCHKATCREQKAAYQEAKLLSTIKHPNIVNYLDSFYNSEGSLFIVMGYCEFGDLYTFIRNRDGLYFQEEQIVNWFVQICMALKYLHDKNILHRDLKTQNIFLTKQKLIKVGDLGIARILKSKQDMATTLVGTPYYMSPEIFSGKPYNQKSDVWALGCCIYEVATLKHAFNAHDLHSLMQKVLKGKVFVTSERYSPDFWKIISSMLDHEPLNRPSVTGILLNDYIRTHILFFLQESSERTRSSASTSSVGNSKDLKSASILPPVSDTINHISAMEAKNKMEISKIIDKKIPDINGNGDGNDNSQEMRRNCKSKQTDASCTKISHDGKCNFSENLKKKSSSVDMNNSFKENLNPTKSAPSKVKGAYNLHTSNQKCSSSPSPKTTSKNNQNSFKLLNNLTYTLKNARLDFRENIEVPKTSQGLVLYSKEKDRKLLDKRQSVSAISSLTCSKRSFSNGECKRVLEGKLNKFEGQTVNKGLLKEIMDFKEPSRSINSANSAARQCRREMKKQKAKNELANLENSLPRLPKGNN